MGEGARVEQGESINGGRDEPRARARVADWRESSSWPHIRGGRSRRGVGRGGRPRGVGWGGTGACAARVGVGGTAGSAMEKVRGHGGGE